MTAELIDTEFDRFPAEWLYLYVDALKLSHDSVAGLRKAIKLTKPDRIDLLFAAHFANDVNAREVWHNRKFGSMSMFEAGVANKATHDSPERCTVRRSND